jgi:hypothetical protein
VNVQAPAKSIPASAKTGVYCLANDNVIEWFEAFIRSYQLDNAALPLTVIPFNENISRLKSLQARFRFDILDESQCRRFDALATQVTGSDRLAGAYRKFASFFGPYDEFLFLDSDIIVTTPLRRLFEAFRQTDYDFVYFDYDMDMAYQPALAARMMADYQSHGFNSGAFLSRKEILREADLSVLAEKATLVREGLAGTLEQPFLNFVLDVSGSRMTGMSTLLTELAPKVWARQPFHYDGKNRVAKTSDGKVLPFIHWPGCGYPGMVRPEIFLEYRTLGMTIVERLNYKREFYYRRFRRQLKQILLKSKLSARAVELREKLK